MKSNENFIPGIAYMIFMAHGAAFLIAILWALVISIPDYIENFGKPQKPASPYLSNWDDCGFTVELEQPISSQKRLK